MPKARARFSSAELARVLSYYDIGIIQRLKNLRAGSGGAAKIVVVSERGKYLLKRRAKGKEDVDRTAFAHSIQTKLAQMNFPVARLVADRNGSTIVCIDHHLYELFEFMAGSRYNGSAASTVDAGRQLGRFHTHLSNFSSSYNPVSRSFHDSAAVRRHLGELSATEPGKDSTAAENLPGKDDGSAGQLAIVATSLGRIYETAAKQANDSGFASWPEQIIHGDWHPGNMLFSGDRVVAVLDFDSVKVAAGVTDLANAMLQFSIVAGRPNPADWPDYLDQAKLVQILAGYQEVRTLAETQLAELLDLMVETMIAEAVLPIVATGFFGNLSGLDFLKMIRRKCDWINQHRQKLTRAIRTQKV